MTSIMKVVILIATLAVCLACGTLANADYSIDWIQYPQSISGSCLEHMAAASPDGTIYAGTTCDEDPNGFDIVVVRLDPAGNILGVDDYDGPTHQADILFELVSHPQGGYVFAGHSTVSDNEGTVVIGKRDDDGNTEWLLRDIWPDFDYEILYDFGVATDGSIRALIGIYNESRVQIFTWLIKINADGDIDWMIETPTTPDMIPVEIDVDSDGSVVIISEVPTEQKYTIVKLDPYGEVIWENNFLPVMQYGDFPPVFVRFAENGEVLFVSETHEYIEDNGFGDNVLVVRYDVDGEVRWDRSIGEPDEPPIIHIESPAYVEFDRGQDDANIAAFAGDLFSDEETFEGLGRALTMRIDDEGDVQWAIYDPISHAFPPGCIYSSDPQAFSVDGAGNSYVPLNDHLLCNYWYMISVGQGGVKYDAAGRLRSRIEFGQLFFEILDMAILPEGDFVILAEDRDPDSIHWYDLAIAHFALSCPPDRCALDNDCYAPGETRALNPCEYCDPAVSTTQWQTFDDGTDCDDRAWCNGADTCVAGECAAHDGDPCPGPPVCNEQFNDCRSGMGVESLHGPGAATTTTTTTTTVTTSTTTTTVGPDDDTGGDDDNAADDDDTDDDDAVHESNGDGDSSDDSGCGCGG